MTQLTDQPRHILVRCEVENRKKIRSTRFVEKAHYQLWRYMVTTKHELIVREEAVCLWMAAQEFERQKKLFTQAGGGSSGSGGVEAVNQIGIAIFDPNTGMCDTLQRFVPLTDSQTVSELLLKRIPKNLQDSSDFAMQVEPGFAIIQPDQVDTSQLGLVVSS